MWTSMQFGGSSISRQYRSLENQLTVIAKQYLDSNQDNGAFTIIINDKPYNVLFSMYALVMQLRTNDLHHRLATRIGDKELSRYCEIITQPNHRYSYNTFIALKKQSESQYKIDEKAICALSGLSEYSAYYDMVSAITQTNPGLFGKMITEAILLAYIAFKVSDEDFFVNNSTVHVLAVYYWASKNSAFSKFKANVNNKVFEKSRKNMSVSKDESFDNFVYRNVKTKFSADLALSLLINNENYFCPHESYYSNIGKLLESVRLQVETSSSAKECYELLYNSYKEGNQLLPKSIIRLMGTDNAESYAYASLTVSLHIPKFVTILNYYVGLLWVYREYYDIGNKDVLDEDTMLKLEDDIKLFSSSINDDSFFFTSKLITLMLPSLMDSLNNQTSDNQSLREDAKDKDKKLTDIKADIRTSEKERKKLEVKVECLENELAHIKSKVELHSKIESIEKQQSIIDRLSTENIKNRDIITDQSRKIRSLQREKEDLKKSINRINTTVQTLNENISRLEDTNTKLSSMSSESSVEFSAYINAIIDKRITIIGARKLHSRMESYGLKNLRLYEEECKNIQLNDIINQDIVVVMTSFIDHSSIAKVGKMCKQYNIKLLNYNNANIDSLIYSIFSEIYR